MTVRMDRVATLRQADKLLRQGKLEQAIAEYQALVDDQPRDWNTANSLGDLFVRAGQADRAVDEFSRVAEALSKEGFFAKAAALYKKILKLRPDDDRAMVRAGQLSAEQGLLAEARTFFITAAAGRRARGDLRGAADLVIRIGSLDKHDVAARLAAADARHAFDDIKGAVAELTDLSTMLIEDGRDDDALAALRQLAALDPANGFAQRELARILVGQGRVDEAAEYLTVDTIGQDAELVILAAQARLRRGDTATAFEMIDTLLAVSAGAVARVAALADTLVAEQPGTAFSLIDRIVSVRIAERDWQAAVDCLQSFTATVPEHVPALTRLVDICVDAGLQTEVIDAQRRLADAYLKTGAVEAARFVAQDLVARQPGERAHLDRLRAAYAATGEADPDQAVADWVASLESVTLEDQSGAGSSGREPGHDASALATSTEPTLVSPAAARPNPFALDVDVVLGTHVPTGSVNLEPGGVGTSRAGEDIGPPAAAAEPSHPGDLESVFAQMREQAVHRSPEDAAEVAYAHGVALLEMGQPAEAVEHLRLAMRAPAKRFASAVQLARVYQQLGRAADAIEWLGHAVDAPGITAAERFDTLHRLAELLETTGESARALAVCLELQADAGDFRDVAERIARLSRAQAGG